MYSNTERAIKLLGSLPPESIKTAYIAVISAKNSRVDRLAQYLFDRGWIEITADHAAVVTDDGRDIIRVLGKAYVLRPEVHSERLAAEFEAAKKVQSESEIKSVVGTESISSMTCTKCGDTIQYSKVCPACAAGKLGYQHRYTCVCGGVDLISKEIL